jgi:hypothetical protein
LLLSDVEHGSKAVCRYKVLWLAPVFAVGMGIFYIAQSGWSYFVDSMMNMIVMSLLLRHTIGGILYLRKDPASAARKRWLYILILAVCIGEYGTSVVSCFWMGDTLKNPYFWFDFLLSLAYLLLPAALKKAVK